MPEEDIKSLVEQRGLIKEALTRMKTSVDRFKFDKDNINQLKARLPNLQSLLKEFTIIQDQIELKDKTEKQSKERDEFETKYYDVESVIRSFIDQHQNASLCLSNPPRNESNVAQIQTASTSNVRLPLLNLPTFEGTYTDWMAFHDTFEALIHESRMYSNIEKFHYLRSCLRGDALKTIDSVSISDINYTTAWELLKKRYENLRLIVQDHVFALLNSPQLQKDSHSCVRQLVDDVCINLEALKSLKQPVDQWDAILIPIIVLKFDFYTRKEWESTLNSEIPKIQSMVQFLEKKCLLLESLNSSNKQQRQSKTNHVNVPRPTNHFNKSRTINCLTTNTKFQCFSCKGNHALYRCNQFLNLSVTDRIKRVEELNLCKNCFRNNHTSSNCKSGACRTCNLKHNSLLHTVDSNSTTSTVVGHTYTYNNTNTVNNVLLSTAQLLIKDAKGNWIKCRALLDVGSQSNIITKDASNLLQLSLNKINIPINGINDSSINANYKVDIEFKSIYSSRLFNTQCLVLQKITENLPTITFSTKDLQIPSNLPLADPAFHESNKIDILLGAGLFWSLLRSGQVPETLHNPHFQETELGWVIGGNINYNGKCSRSLCHLSTLEKQMTKFWEIEEGSNHKHSQFSLEEQNCIEHFKETHTRDIEGRFIVRLPFKDNARNFKNSKSIAIKRLYGIENKLNRDPELKLDYHKFMQEYVDLKHMNLLSTDHVESESHCYLPHHAVTKESSSTTKVRVVFDASATTSTGISLNDTLMVGPRLQDNLMLILLRYRMYQFVLSADIHKMYRQILVAEEDRKFQRIVWRASESDSVASYELNTVTYGTACAPYLAIQCLQQLALDERQHFPDSYEILTRDFYMDDLLTGTNSFKDALQLRNELQSLLLRGGFELRKWSSNNPALLPQSSETNSLTHMINLEKGTSTKLLGLWWDYKQDTLNYVINVNVRENQNLNHTKRSILSKISQIFDPLGLLSPIIIRAKIMLQHLWQIKQGWDDPLPNNSKTSWIQLINQFDEINKINIPRKVIDCYPTNCIQLHGFSDASEKAYGACVYVRSANSNGKVSVHLLCAKSRVAPLKVLTIPRLELCGALLLGRLMKTVVESVHMNFEHIFYWTDSTIVLAWLRTTPNNLKTFVANRVVELQSCSNIDDWQHVKSSENPADLITRGISVNNLIDNSLWFHGPVWLVDQSDNWVKSTVEISILEIPEQRTLSHAITIPEYDWMLKYSKFKKLQRITAYILRFINNCRSHNKRLTGELNAAEIECATNIIIKSLQKSEFTQELEKLLINQAVSNKSNLKTLNPFLDETGIIRVGGRLRHAKISADQKHPIVLPKHQITESIIKYTHEMQLHAGNLGTLAAIRERYWPLAGRSQVRKVLNKCISCFRVKPKGLNPIMGDLPASRFDYTRPFTNCGVDYAGPIFIKEGRGRGKRKIKAYICVFVCFATKAMHLELVSDLTSESFLSSFKRFISRRGLVKNLYSDNATNFVGAQNELYTLATLFQSQHFKETVINKLTTESSLNWHFIPARSPHFGGLWEAGVKSVKYHLKRVIGNALLTFEEMYTLLTCIEACLNSRPICPLSNDPNDLAALTPGHFLIGAPLTTSPEPSLMEVKQNRLSRWQYLEQSRQHFWKRWVKEYLGYLQARPNSKSTDTTLRPGMLVILKDINLPPLVWKYGRILQVHPGPDGITRVASVQTEHGVTKRAVRNMCVVPVSEFGNNPVVE